MTVTGPPLAICSLKIGTTDPLEPKTFPKRAFAVDIKNSFQTFNIAGQWDWGCSSLYEFSDDIESKWPNRPDFKKTHSYTVPTITLYDFCNLYGIDKIDFLHIDAQGSDYNVLLSLKDKISIVKEGTIEVAEPAIHLGSADAAQLKTQAAEASGDEAAFLNAAIAAL